MSDTEERPRFVVVGARPPGERPLWERALVVARERTAGLREEAIDWCRDRSWEARVPVLLYFAVVLYRHWTNLEYSSWLKGLNLGFHELGHAVFGPFGELMSLAGGTILQCLTPLIAAYLLYRTQRDFFGVAFCLAWLATNLFDAGTYAADARGQLNLVLVTPFGGGGQGFGADGIGDWSRMLGMLGMLEWDRTISGAFRLGGVAAMLGFFALSGWLLWQMQRLRGEPPPPPPSWATGPAPRAPRPPALPPEDPGTAGRS